MQIHRLVPSVAVDIVDKVDKLPKTSVFPWKIKVFWHWYRWEWSVDNSLIYPHPSGLISVDNIVDSVDK